ncbi:MAG: hypothetical protein RIS64_4621 [Bacteroidota bacterium]|jgi:hypothetical protein
MLNQLIINELRLKCLKIAPPKTLLLSIDGTTWLQKNENQ